MLTESTASRYSNVRTEMRATNFNNFSFFYFYFYGETAEVWLR